MRVPYIIANTIWARTFFFRQFLCFISCSFFYCFKYDIVYRLKKHLGKTVPPDSNSELNAYVVSNSTVDEGKPLYPTVPSTNKSAGYEYPTKGGKSKRRRTRRLKKKRKKKQTKKRKKKRRTKKRYKRRKKKSVRKRGKKKN